LFGIFEFQILQRPSENDMKDLPADWYEQSMRPLREEEPQWPAWMRNGVAAAREEADRKLEDSRASENFSNGKRPAS
jgi:hypothetical protein